MNDEAGMMCIGSPANEGFMNSRYMNDYPDVLKPEECANVLAIGRNSVYQLLKQGELRSIRIGKQYRIPKAYLQNFLKMGYNKGNTEDSVF